MEMDEQFPHDPSRFVTSAYAGPNDSGKSIETFDPEIAERVQFIMDLVGMCLSRSSIVQEVIKKYGICRAMAYRYYNTAMWEMRQELAKTREQHAVESINSAKTIMKRATAKGDHSAAIRALAYKDAVIGLTNPTNETGNMNAADPGTSQPLGVESIGIVAKAIAHAQTAVDESQSPSVGDEQLQNG